MSTILCNSLQNLFDNYVLADLVVAGASEGAVRRLIDGDDPDVAGRFDGIRAAWERSRPIAERVYGMDEITPEGLEAARERNLELRASGERLQLLREVGKLDHVQIDDGAWSCLPDESSVDFFLYDLNWRSFAAADFESESVYQEVGVEITDLEELRRAMEAIFAEHGPRAVGVKTQHAYNRTLQWQARDDADAARALEKRLAGRNSHSMRRSAWVTGA